MIERYLDLLMPGCALWVVAMAPAAVWLALWLELSYRIGLFFIFYMLAWPMIAVAVLCFVQEWNRKRIALDALGEE